MRQLLFFGGSGAVGTMYGGPGGAADALLLADGSSGLLLADGSSFLLLSGN